MKYRIFYSVKSFFSYTEKKETISECYQWIKCMVMKKNIVFNYMGDFSLYQKK